MTDPATAPVSASTPPSPGEYLLCRRTVGANLTRETVARQLAALPLAPWPITAAAIAALEQRIERAERDIEPSSRAQAETYRGIVPLDPEVYLKLALRLADGPGSTLPVPQICRSCACSFFDPCIDRHSRAVCGWSAFQSDLCTACELAPPAGPVPARIPVPSPMEIA